MPEAAFIVSPGQSRQVTELAQTIIYELERQNVPGEIHEAFPEPAADRVYVWMDPAGYLTAEGREAAPGKAVLRRTVLLFDEHRVPAPDDGELFELARQAGTVFCLDQVSLNALARQEVPARLLRPGFSDHLDCFEPGGERPIDITFLGARTPRRVELLRRAERVLSRYRTELHLLERDPETGVLRAELPDKWELLRQSKLVLNLHCGQEADLEWRRVLDATHAGAVVVSEQSSSLAPLVAGEHLLVGAADAVPFLAEQLLRDPEQMERMRLAAHERLQTWMPFALPVSVLRAALVELVGEPLAADAPRGRLTRV